MTDLVVFVRFAGSTYIDDPALDVSYFGEINDRYDIIDEVIAAINKGTISLDDSVTYDHQLQEKHLPDGGCFCYIPAA